MISPTLTDPQNRIDSQTWSHQHHNNSKIKKEKKQLTPARWGHNWYYHMAVVVKLGSFLARLGGSENTTYMWFGQIETWVEGSDPGPMEMTIGKMTNVKLNYFLPTSPKIPTSICWTRGSPKTHQDLFGPKETQAGLSYTILTDSGWSVCNFWALYWWLFTSVVQGGDFWPWILPKTHQDLLN